MKHTSLVKLAHQEAFDELMTLANACHEIGRLGCCRRKPSVARSSSSSQTKLQMDVIISSGGVPSPARERGHGETDSANVVLVLQLIESRLHLLDR